MSHYDYEMSKRIQMEDYPFYALIMAAIRQADSHNIEKLKRVFPAVHEELFARYNAPAGFLPSEWESGEAERYLEELNKDKDALA